jgi:hypothetical protein
MALGAQGRDVLGLVMKESMMVVGIGVIIGLMVAFSVRGLVQSLFFGLAATDPPDDRRRGLVVGQGVRARRISTSQKGVSRRSISGITLRVITTLLVPCCLRRTRADVT